MTDLPDFGDATSRPRWPLPIGEIRSTMRPVMFSCAVHVALEAQRLVRVQRRQVFEQDAVLRGFRRFAVDLVHLYQCKVALAVFRRAHFAFDRVTRMQVEAADLRRRDIDVVGRCHVARIGRAQEAEAVRQYLERAVAENLFALTSRAS
jgi:hypothetical protein